MAGEHAGGGKTGQPSPDHHSMPPTAGPARREIGHISTLHLPRRLASTPHRKIRRPLASCSDEAVTASQLEEARRRTPVRLPRSRERFAGKLTFDAFHRFYQCGLKSTLEDRPATCSATPTESWSTR